MASHLVSTKEFCCLGVVVVFVNRLAMLGMHWKEAAHTPN